MLAHDELLAGRLAHLLHLLQQVGDRLDLLGRALLRDRVHDHPEVLRQLLQLLRGLQDRDQVLLAFLALFQLKEKSLRSTDMFGYSLLVTRTGVLVLLLEKMYS